MARQRARIAQAAFEIALDRGLNGLTIEALSDHSGCSVGAIYLHFKNKSEILRALVEHRDGVIHSLNAIESYADLERVCIMHLVEPRDPREAALWMEILALSLRDRDVARQFDANVGAIETAFGDALQRLMRRGSIAPRHDIGTAARLLRALQTGSYTLHLTSASASAGPSADEFRIHVRDLLRPREQDA